MRFIGAKTVKPAHRSGAALAESSESGIAKANRLSVRTKSANPPYLLTHVSTLFRHKFSYPFRHHSQRKQLPDCHPTPTRLPTLSRLTLTPVAPTAPTISCPGTSG